MAAYFAVVDNWHADAAIWMLSPWVVIEGAKLVMDPHAPVKELALQPGSPHVVLALPAGRPTDRMVAQVGNFTFGLNVAVDQGQAIEEIFSNPAIEAEDQLFTTLQIPAALKPEFLRRLRHMGISGRTMFPGADGLGRAIAGYVKLWAAATL